MGKVLVKYSLTVAVFMIDVKSRGYRAMLMSAMHGYSRYCACNRQLVQIQLLCVCVWSNGCGEDVYNAG